jgi:hypothetical protein
LRQLRVLETVDLAGKTLKAYGAAAPDTAFVKGITAGESGLDES